MATKSKAVKRKATKRKSTAKRAAPRKKAAKRAAPKRRGAKRAAPKRRAAARVDRHPIYRQVQVEYTSHAKKQKIEPHLDYRIDFKIDSGNMSKDSATLGKIIDDVDTICVPLKIKYKYEVRTGCLFVSLGLYIAVPILLSVASMAIYDLLKKINSRKNTNTTHISEPLKIQLLKANLMDRGEVGYFIESGDKINIGTKFLVHFQSGVERTVIITDKGIIQWI